MKQDRVGSEIFTQEPEGDDGIAISRCQVAHLSLFFSLFSFHKVCMQPHGVGYDVRDCRNRMDGLLEGIIPELAEQAFLHRISYLRLHRTNSSVR